MKRILFIIIISLLSFSIFAQNKIVNNVSNKVKVELKKMYPNVKSIKWSSHGEGATEASFNIRGKRVIVTFKADKLFAEMIEINKNKLPKAVKKHLEEYYKEYSIIQTFEIKLLSNIRSKGFRYWISLGKGKSKTTIIYNSNGYEMTAFNNHISKKN